MLFVNFYWWIYHRFQPGLEYWRRMGKVGRHTYGNPIIYRGAGDLRIGAFCSIGMGVKIVTGEEHRTDWVSQFPFPHFFPEAASIPNWVVTKGDVIIGNDVWIGTGALILSGVRIGDGAVVGANAVVTRDVMPYAIVAGNPARLVRYRFDRRTVGELLRTRWWDWPDEKILQNIGWLCQKPLKN